MIAIGNAAIGLMPIALVSANHIETVPIPQVIRIAQPRLWNFTRSVGQRARISGRAPESTTRN